MITGGTGSFGHTFLDYLLREDFKEVRIFSRDELKQELMRTELNNPKVKFHIGDIRNRDSVDDVMKDVDYVFHAAALKQVPSCEFFPMQAVLTNVIGSHNIIESAIRNGVSKLICLGTDKAVYPINTMGVTKALMEKVAQAASRNLMENETLIASVRYGNVMCSRGSVIPLFIKQIKENKAITLTVPEMTRFMMPLRDAIDLVVYAFKNAKQGNIFIRKSPACSVMDLATALKNIFNSKAEIKVIGMRHGEKLHETLASREELAKAEDLGNYYRVCMDGRDLNYNKYTVEGDVKEADLEDYTSFNTQRMNLDELEKLLLSIPEVSSELN
ncbi:MAG: polysaccharide biosynthesis protein [Nitrospinota bacterium]|nr:polysaccharide biosynthesis protein [Nitrospinota bacterium]